MLKDFLYTIYMHLSLSLSNSGVLMRAPIHKRIDIFFSVLGCALFVASGVFIIEAWEFSFRTRTRDLALIKASLSIVNGVLFGFDAIFTFRDK